MISESDIERALSWMVEHADRAAAARANRVWIEEYTKVVLADQMGVSDSSSAAGQERDARASQDYRNHLLAVKEAVMEDERYRLLYRTAESRIEAWRSMQANQRIQGKIG